MTPEAPKVTRARMIIELSDGSARYYQALDPELVRLQHEYVVRGPAEPLIRIKGASRWQVRIEQDSGEIPPELAERAAAAIAAVEGRLILEDLDHPLLLLRPYLARIAGRQT